MRTKLQTKRATLLREAEALRAQDGTFADDAARTAFDAKMTEIEVIDKQIRALDATSPATPAPAADAAGDAATATVRAAAVTEERTRVTGIQDAVRIAKLPTAFATDLVTRGVTLDAARAAIFAELATQDRQVPTESHLAVGDDAQDKWVRGAANWLFIKSGAAELIARASKTEPSAIDPGEFRGLTLLDLARQVLERAGRTVRGLDKMRLVSEALTLRAGYQSTSDFAVLLENVMHKVLQAAYATQPDTWRAFCATSTNSDFRAHNRYRTGSFGALDVVNENGEFKNKAIPDGEKASITLATKGNIIAVTRQAIINDDMGAITRMTAMLGRAAGLSVEIDVYALLALNAGLGPTMDDALPLFDAGHNNLGAGAAITAASLDADSAVMAAQTDLSGNEILDLRPDILVVPRGLQGQAKVINASQYDPDATANKAMQRPNVAQGMFSTIVGTARLAAGTTRRYLFANPAVAPVLEVAFLEGQTAPVLESQDGWRVDGAEMKVRFDYKAGAVDFRGAVTNAGV